MFYRWNLQLFTQRGPAKVKQDHVIKRTRELEDRDKDNHRGGTPNNLWLLAHLATWILSMETVSGIIVPELGGVRSTDSQRTINSPPSMMTAAGMWLKVQGDRGLNRLKDWLPTEWNHWQSKLSPLVTQGLLAIIRVWGDWQQFVWSSSSLNSSRACCWLWMRRYRWYDWY